MIKEKIPLEHTGYFKNIFLDYLQQKKNLSSFYTFPPEKGSFPQAAASRSFSSTKRKQLSGILEDQYQQTGIQGPALKNLRLLEESNTFTVTTGHQLNIFTGPLYFIYKVITAINITRKLNEDYPDYHFVPVFWMASEDHDVEEINHFNLFGETYTWETDQQGAVGRFNTAGLEQVLDAMDNPVALFERAYRDYPTLSQATRYILDQLFGEEGLIVIDPDQRELKELFKPSLKHELKARDSEKVVEETSAALEKMGYDRQVQPRPVNLFYLKDAVRERLIYEDGHFYVHNTDYVFSEEEILQELEDFPERFSPNVVLRPLYQETILPNTGYVGGPAEVAYWLQLAGLFEVHNLAFPVLYPRNNVLILPHVQNEKINKLGVDIQELFVDSDALIKNYLARFGEQDYRLSSEKESLIRLFEEIKDRGKRIDATLENYVIGERKKAEKVLDDVEKKFKKALEKKEENRLNQLKTVKEFLFPDNKLQERFANLLNFYINNPEIIRVLLNEIDPFDFKIQVIIEDDKK